MKISAGGDDEQLSVNNLNQEELELIGAYLEYTILGRSTYAQAAYTLHEKIANVHGASFTDNAFKKVQPVIHELDPNGVVIGRIQPGNYEFKV